MSRSDQRHNGDLKPSVFYRYIRPARFLENRAEVVVSPNGGVCLRFEIYSGQLWFTFARGSSKDRFSKDVAKKIADHRSMSARIVPIGDITPFAGILPKVTKDTDELITLVIDWCLTWSAPETPTGKFLQVEYDELAKQLAEIRLKNSQQEKTAEEWKSIQAAANFAGQYRAPT